MFKKQLVVYPGKNNVRGILRNVIWCLDDWELEKTVFHKKSKPQIGVFSRPACCVNLIWQNLKGLVGLV